MSSDLTPEKAIGILESYAATVDSEYCVTPEERQELWDEFTSALRALGWVQNDATRWVEVDDEQELIHEGMLVKVEMTPQPDPFALLRELREALGMFSGAMPIPPEEAWQQALMRVRDLVWRQTMIDRTGGRR